MYWCGSSGDTYIKVVVFVIVAAVVVSSSTIFEFMYICNAHGVVLAINVIPCRCVIQPDGDNENGDSQQQLQSSEGPESSSKKKEMRSNAKSVECFDLSGNLLYVFKSGMIASQTLNISQGDISQCCRGIKRSHMGYKFRFFGDAADRKKGAWKEGDGNQRADLMRSTRQANRWSGTAEGRDIRSDILIY